jgi:flagellar assembly protein FliH
VLSAREARLLSDAAVARGGCLVESDIGVIDASIEARWRRASASLGCEEPWIEAAVEAADDGDAA